MEEVKGRKRRFKKGIIVIDMRSVRTTKMRFFGESFNVMLRRLSFENLLHGVGRGLKVRISDS